MIKRNVGLADLAQPVNFKYEFDQLFPNNFNYGQIREDFKNVNSYIFNEIWRLICREIYYHDILTSIYFSIRIYERECEKNI